MNSNHYENDTHAASHDQDVAGDIRLILREFTDKLALLANNFELPDSSGSVSDLIGLIDDAWNDTVGVVARDCDAALYANPDPTIPLCCQ